MLKMLLPYQIAYPIDIIPIINYDAQYQNIYQRSKKLIIQKNNLSNEKNQTSGDISSLSIAALNNK